ncbi:metalloenzyme domain protein [Deinococcus arenicola]|uniref:Metalloenzyme domain protein n=1 Tax=Deinococcus arenicola TaxID=2994950 RepID=A0ABU4DPP8_9DEIO|nr:metalloenzyme domain protein [Deinococcus sp. ZS9-10]MDV6374403.1 metalloenzyme domain protein [Deinococcus sp. ZS9-10]
MSGLVWLALDGVGHPADAPPGSVWEQDLPALRPLIDAGLAVDATLGVPGLPQSGTGQSCWLTGTDAVRLMGKNGMGEHFGPHPGPTLQRLLRQFSLPQRMKAAGLRPALANHYVPQYLEAQARRPRMGCFPFSFTAAGLPLNPPGVPPLGATLGLGYREPWTPFQTLAEVTEVGRALAKAAHEHDLIVADLWFGDLLGHLGREDGPTPQVRAAASAYLARVDALLAGLLDAGARVVIGSDHGNLEDLNTKSHTVGRVPFAGSGVNLGGAADEVEAGRIIAGWFGLPPVELGPVDDAQSRLLPSQD